MGTGNIFKSMGIESRIICSKIKFFFAATFLGKFLLVVGINDFIYDLNTKGLLGLGSEFRPQDWIWGNTVWLNIIHTLILSFSAGLFGFFLGYFLHRISTTQKIIFSTLYVFMGFFLIGFVSIILETFFEEASILFNNIIGAGFHRIAYSVFSVIFMIIGYTSQFLFSIYFMNKGESVINNPKYTIDKSDKGTLLDIKWYHYFWLWFPIAFYTRLILNMIYKLGHTIVILVQNFKLSTIFGVSDGEKGNALDIAWGGFILSTLVTAIVIFLMIFLRYVLIDKTQYNHWLKKTMTSIIIGLIIPLLILWFTNLVV
jgi:hypothetical protein